MATWQELQEIYSQWDTESLLEIAAEGSGFTELAVAVAREELKLRKVSDEEIKHYERKLNVISPEMLENYLIDLKLWQKVIFFFLWVPRIRNMFNYNFIPHEYKLKSDQATYYSFVGGLIFILAALLTMSKAWPFWIWPLGFVPTYLFDILYNKKRQVKYLQRKVEEGRDPMDEFS